MWTFVLFGDRLTLRQAAGICVSLCGVAVIVCHGSLAVLLAIAFNRGDVSFLVALVVYGFYAAYLRQPARRSIRSHFLSSAWAAARSC